MIRTLKSTRMFRYIISTLVVLTTLGAVSGVSAQVSAEKIFPDSTKGFVVIRNLDDLGKAWRTTQIGTLMNDPIMEAFKKDVRTKMDQRMEERLGFTFDEIKNLPSGELAVGMVAIPDQVPGYVFTMGIKDRRKEVDDYLTRLSSKLLESGVKRNIEKHKGSEIIVFTFPKRFGTAPAAKIPGSAPAAKGTTKKPGETDKAASKTATEETEPERQAFYLIKNDILVVGDQLHLVKLFSDRLEGESRNSLADVEDFKIVMARCMKDVGDKSTPFIRWYIEPLNYGESIRVLMKGPIAEKRRSKPSVFTVLKQQGFDAIHGIGGVVSIKAENMETVYRIFAHTKKPYKLAMKMLVFPENVKFEQQNWTPGDVARCTMISVDPLAIFDNIGPLFDSLVMQGETGIWDDIIKGLKEDENGPQIDLREEIIVHLGQRVFSMSKYQMPITTNSEGIVVGVELKEGKEKNMIDALKKLFENDPEMEGTKHGPYVLWHRIQVEEVIKPFSGPTGAPDLVSSIPTTRPTQPAGTAAQPESEPVFPSGAVTVAKGFLFFSTKRDFLTSVLDRLDADVSTSIKNVAEFKAVEKVFEEIGMKDKPHFLQFFGKTDETVRPTYEMIRQGKMPQSQAVLSKLVNAVLVPEDKENRTSREQAIDGKNLPDFDKIKHYFGPAGIIGVSEDDGLFFKGFLLEKKTAEQLKEEAKPKPEPKPEPKKEEPKKEEPKKVEPQKAEPKKEEPKKEEPKKVEPKKEEPKKEEPKKVEPKKEEPKKEEPKKAEPKADEKK